MAYTKQRSNWLDYPTTSTPILAANLNAWETAISQIKNFGLNIQDDYGAVADNSTDNATAIAASISDAAATGKSVLIPPTASPFRVASALSVPDFVNIIGFGQSSHIRASGNHYIFNLNPANRSSIKNLQVSAASAQASGGGFDFTNARNNVRLDNIYVGNNLFTTFNIKPNAVSGHFYISRVKWNGSTGCTNGLLIGDGTNLLAHVILRELLCVPATAADMTNFMVIKNNVDTLKGSVVECYGATNGILVGENAANDVTDSFFERCLLDSITNTGLDVAKCRGFNWMDGQIQTSGTGINVGTLSKGFKATGTVQNCTSDGVTIQAGAIHTDCDLTVSDNNTSNGAFGQGYDVVGGTTHLKIRGRIGNGILLASGHQKYGVSGSAGASDNIDIDATFVGNETAPVDISAFTGGKKRVTGLGLTTPTVASATTITLPGNPLVTVSGTTSITSVTAGYVGQQVTLVFSGILTFTDGSNLKLAGNFVTTADDSISLVCDGTNWYETARSVN